MKPEDDQVQEGFKICSKCGIVKELIEYPKAGGGRIRNECKKCHSLYVKNHTNKDRVKIYRHKNSDNIKRSAAKYRESGKANINYNKWKINNTEKVKNKNKIYYEINKNKIKNNRNEKRKIWHSMSLEYKRLHRLKNRLSYLKSNKIYTKKTVDEITDNYVITLLRLKGFINYRKNNLLIEVQRQIIKNKRLCKTLENSATI